MATGSRWVKAVATRPFVGGLGAVFEAFPRRLWLSSVQVGMARRGDLSESS